MHDPFRKEMPPQFQPNEDTLFPSLYIDSSQDKPDKDNEYKWKSQESKSTPFPYRLTHSKLYHDKLSDEKLLSSNIASKLMSFPYCQELLSPNYLINSFTSDITSFA